MKVELLNKEEVQNLFKTWGTFSKVCYATKTSKPENIGKHCLKSEHFSGSRATYINFKLEDIPRSTVDQLARKTVGMVINVRSQRYCDESNFEMYVPTIIENNKELKPIWDKHIEDTRLAYQETKRVLKEEFGYTGEKANEIARGLLPIDTYSQCTVGFTIEGLIDFMHKRLCTRSQAPIRKLANKMKKVVLEVLPELEEYLVPKCEHQLFCSESHPCGKAPSKGDVLAIMNYGITMAEKSMKEVFTNEEVQS